MSKLVPAPLLQLYMQDLGLESKYKILLLLSASGRAPHFHLYCDTAQGFTATSQQTALGLNHLWCICFSLAQNEGFSEFVDN